MKLKSNDWNAIIDIADRFKLKAKYQDRIDLKHSIIQRIAELSVKRNETLSFPAMLRVASYVCQEYWHKEISTLRRICVYSGIAKQPNYAHCRFKHKPDSCKRCCYLSNRPNLSIEYELDCSDGESVTILDTLADDSAIDLDAWLDAKRWLLGCPTRILRIAIKRMKGEAIGNADRLYLNHFIKDKHKANWHKLPFATNL